MRDGRVRAAGWTEPAEISFADALGLVAGRRVLVTAIDRDGTLAGPDLELVAAAAAAGARVLAAGGVRTPADVRSLAAAGAEAASSAARCSPEPGSFRRICPSGWDAVPFGKTVF